MIYRSKSYKEDEGIWRGNDDGKVVKNQPRRVMGDHIGIGPQGRYIAKYNKQKQVNMSSKCATSIINRKSVL